MNKRSIIILAIGFCLYLPVGVGGCKDWLWSQGRAKYQKTVKCQSPLEDGSTVVAETDAGSITVTGSDVNDCNLIATIYVMAPTEQQARQIAEQVKIRLEPAGKTLTIKANEPTKKHRCAISVSYNVIVPKQTNLECASSYGSIKFANINGSVIGKSGSGLIATENIRGSTKLNTSYGSVTCKDVAGDNVIVKSGSGSITAESVRGSAQFETSYGSIICKGISGGDIKLKTGSGKITLSEASFADCDVHTAYGSIVSDRLSGNSVKMDSGSGGITLTEFTANTTNVSTSYGKIACRQIATANLVAKTGSGDVDIICSASAPVELAANVISSYGSISFAAPPGFAGQIDAATDYGLVKNELAVTTTTQISKKKVTGRVGEGKGNLRLRTASGTINVK